MIWLLVKYVLSAAIKDRLFLGLLGLVIVGLSLSIFLGSAALTETDQFSLVFAAAGLRIGGLITLILFTVFYLRRSFDSHDVDYMLSRPITRFQFLLAHTIALSILSFIVVALICLTLLVVPSQTGIESVAMWGVSLLIEYIIVVNTALFFAMILSSAVTASLITLGFYLLSRLVGGILLVIADTDADNLGVTLIEKVMLFISVFIPRLDLMGQTSWLIYGFENYQEIGFLVLQGGVFMGLVFAASFWDLKRKQF